MSASFRVSKEKLQLKFYGDPVLRQVGEKIVSFDEKLERFAREMLDLMYRENGAGLAAQQAGYALQLCVVDLQLPKNHDEEPAILDGKEVSVSDLMPLFVVNPIIEKESEDVWDCVEPCLSLPNMRAKVTRSESIVVSFSDLKGESHTMECGGYLARCLMHEIDHLQGVLYIDRLHPRELDKLKPKLKKLKRETKASLK